MKLRKTVYVLDLYNLNSHFVDMFQYQRETPLPLISVNGVACPRDKVSKGQKTKSFPNPATYDVLFKFYFTKTPHTKFSTTIVEYFDSKNKPILYLFPDGSTFATVANPQKQMNSRQRYNLQYEKQLRLNMMVTVKKR